MTEQAVIAAIRDGLAEEMRRNERIVVMGEDVGVRGGVFRATEGLQREFGPDRVMDAPLAESGIVGVAIGMALVGLRPVAEIQFADFIYPAMDQIVSEAARLRFRSGGDWSAPVVIRVPYGGPVGGGLYHSQSVEALFCHVPGLRVVAPSTPADAKGLLKTALRQEDPLVYFEHKKTYRLIKGEVPDEDYTVPLGKAEVRRAGEDVSVVTFGLMMHHALEAAEMLADEGIDVEVIDLRTLAPMDKETVLESVARTGRLLIVHEDNLTGGFGAEVAAMVAQDGFDYLDAPITRLAAPDVPGIPFSPPLEQAYVITPAKIAESVRRLAEY